MSPAQTDNPTLTDNGLLIVFSTLRGDAGSNSDIYCASRSSVTQPFGGPQPIGVLSTDLIEGSPAVSWDGLTIWLSIKEDGGTSDIWQSSRQNWDADCAAGWLAPVRVAELNSPTADDIPRPLGNNNLTMPLGSRRDGDHFLTYLATRPSAGAAFSDIREANELDATGFNTADAFLTRDGLTIYFTRAMDPVSDIYVAHRATTNATFDPPVPLGSVNTANYKEQDPFIAKDGTLYFTANYDGPMNIYQAFPP